MYIIAIWHLMKPPRQDCSVVAFFFSKLAITAILFSRIPHTVRVSSSLDPDQARHDKLYIVDINKDPGMTLTYMIIIVI